jgi:hypothetical protein
VWGGHSRTRSWENDVAGGDVVGGDVVGGEKVIRVTVEESRVTRAEIEANKERFLTQFENLKKSIEFKEAELQYKGEAWYYQEQKDDGMRRSCERPEFLLKKAQNSIERCKIDIDRSQKRRDHAVTSNPLSVHFSHPTSQTQSGQKIPSSHQSIQDDSTVRFIKFTEKE